jgi:hypothetical protein
VITAPRARAERTARWAPTAVPVAAAAVVCATVAVGLAFQAAQPAGLGDDRFGHFGTPLSPFIVNWAPVLRWPALTCLQVAIAVVVCLACVWCAPMVIASRRAPAAFGVLAYLVTAAIGLAVNAARSGTGGWDHVFALGPHGSSEASREYLTALRLLHGGIPHYVRHYAALLPYLPTHAKGNPPGPVVVMDLLHLTTPGRLAAACIAAGALTGPLAYGLGRALGGERRGRTAAALTAFSPSVVLFGVTSMDYAFAALGTAAAWLLVSPRSRARLGGCLVAALASFFSWLLLAIPVWAVLVVARREGLRPAIVTATGVAVALLAVNGALALTLGYDPIAVVRALAPIYAHGIATTRPYAFWLFGSPTAWLVMLGLPTAWLACRAAGRGEAAGIALATIVVVSALAGFTKAETERIWLPFVPLACVAAASRPVPRIRLVLLALAAQALVIELLFNTIW